MSLSLRLYEHQVDALKRVRNGSILNGGVGSGKSRTSIAYYYTQEGGRLDHIQRTFYEGDRKVYIFSTPKMKNPRDLYIITTAQKRDKLEWEGELVPFLLSTNPEVNEYKNKVVVDSWNNIGKYADVQGAFFIFDEQRLVGTGAWVKTFLKIAKFNHWILLSATPGDTWTDYRPVFIANGFYRNKTEFDREHVVYRRFAKFPQIDRYVDTNRLLRYRNQILIDMDFVRHTIPHHEDVYCKYDISMFKDVTKSRTNPFVQGYIPCDEMAIDALQVGKDISVEEVEAKMMEGVKFIPREGKYVRFTNKPIKNASEFCYTLRKIVNTDESRQLALLELYEKHPRMIIFYNFDYELELLKGLYYGDDVELAEWNGHKHEPIPNNDKWVYLVQYTAGAEGWNCIKTDTIVFYSQNYSYKIMQQSAGRIDRLNTPYTNLYYYHIKSRSGIDLAISKALREKKKFNEKRWVNW